MSVQWQWNINEAYADMSSAMNEDAYTYVTQHTTAVLTATNAAYNAHTSTDEVNDYPTSSTAGNDITTFSNEAYGITQEVNTISITHATDKVHATSSNEAYDVTTELNLSNFKPGIRSSLVLNQRH